MKTLKMRIKREAQDGRTHYEYPVPYYDAHKVVFGPIYEGSIDTYAAEAQGRNAKDEFIIVGVADADAPQFLDANGKDDGTGFIWSCVEVNDAEAEADGGKWMPQGEKIVDQNKVMSILAKIGRGEELTKQEKDALDPDKDEPGINKTKSFKDAHKEHKQKF